MQQQPADLARLPWFTDLPTALVEAHRSGRPILSLRLLGRLDQARSCANSRFFRRMLYPEPRIHEVLRRDFVLQWQSLRPVPIVTIDFGDGRTEAPLLRAVTMQVDADTRQNLALHRRVHEAFARGDEWAGVDGFVDWIYAELFEMPLGDPLLGLDVPDPV